MGHILTVQELLQQIGPVRRVRLDFDRTGRSNGVATANFETHEDAQAAITQFNGKKAAGLEIQVSLMEDDYALYKRVGESRGRFGNDGYRERYDSRNRRDDDRRPRGDKDRPRPVRQQKKTLEELDAELTSYMNGETVEDTSSAPKESENPTNEESVVENSKEAPAERFGGDDAEMVID